MRVRLANREQKKRIFCGSIPYGKIPVLVEDGKVLFESCIINEYLDEKVSQSAVDAERSSTCAAAAASWSDYALNFAHELYWALRGEMLKPEAARDATIVEQNGECLTDLLLYLEAALGDQTLFSQRLEASRT